MSRQPQPRTRNSRRHARRHAGYNTRHRAVAVIGTLAVLGASGATWMANSSNASAPDTTDEHIATPFVAAAVADTDYAIPSDAIFVAPRSSVSAQVAAHANGTAAAPYTSVTAAVKRSHNGGTIVLKSGTYRESLGTIAHRVKLQAYPHAKVWINGAAVLANLKHVGKVWVRSGWNPHICHTCYERGALDRHYPYAGLPDQVFIDNVPQTQVGSAGAVGPGKFYVNTRAGRLYIGSNPNGHHVEATMFEKALQFGGHSSGSSVRGIGFEHYAAHFNMDIPAMVIASASNTTFENDTFAYSAGRGLSVFDPGATVTNNSFIDNGINGFHANAADGLDFERNRVIGSNFEHWSIVPNAHATIGGMKITKTNNAVVKSNVLFRNDSNGIWFDVSSSHLVIADNNVVANAGMGIAVEISGFVTVAGNIASGNGRTGIKIAGSNNVSVWNNTAANNGWSAISVTEDPRSNPHPTNGATWNTAHVTMVNNVLIGRTGAAYSMLESFDGNHPRRTTSSRMITSDDRNVWGRPVPSNPRYMASWQTSNRKTSFTTLSALQHGTGREHRSVSADKDTLSSMFVNAIGGNYALTGHNAAMVRGLAIPSNIAAAMGLHGGTPGHLGALNVPAI